MNRTARILSGLFMTTTIFLIANAIGINIHLKSKFLTDSFLTHTVMLILSALAIYFLRGNMNYKISFPKFKTALKPILIGIGLTIVINISMTIVTKLAGGKIEVHPLFSKMNPLQVFFFVFIYASIAEEILFRGFLLNFLNSSTIKGIHLFKRNFSFPVIISALAFGLAHLILIRTGVGTLFIIRVIVFATSLGLVAGYYQEKYDNNSFAIIVHMAGNSIAVVSALLLSISTS